MKLVPITIPDNVKKIDNDGIKKKLIEIKEEVLYCIEKCSGAERDKKIFEFEIYFTEALLRIMYDKFGFRPYQNKLYEKVDFIFDKKDSYNINRTLSFVRRNRMIGLDFGKDKYKNWLMNRVLFAVPAVIRELPKYYDQNMVKEFDEIIKVKNVKIDKTYLNNK